MTDSITLTRPDDWHLHLRDGALMQQVTPASARRFGRAIVMPNLTPPVTTTAEALAYRERILGACPPESAFTPLMTLYLTDNTTPEMIREAAAQGIIACKLYPAGATTNSDSGVMDIRKLQATLETMAEEGILLLVHGEVTQAEIDIFDREKAFIDNVLEPLLSRLPELRVVMEHITTADAAAFVRSRERNLGATITPQHLLFNRNHLLVGGIRPHFYCLPILKRRDHQEALREVAISGDSRFFLGTDSAPHDRYRKESACGCAGCYSAFAAIELYAQFFEEAGALERLEDFASHFGPDFYGLPRNNDRITLRRAPWTIPEVLHEDAEPIVPLNAGATLNWQLADG
ncbi:dihydroorotase [Halospina denitrificans]|uniref:Dihydroorotase n=1 Tax=Halospina denitrificans TaxID=332522 RepID=A0A4R7JY99_9GAMM|nr:dihydroorotase [Halospina denitrificans]TDT43046.1 dihydroorotase [Halospina denitrificans]